MNLVTSSASSCSSLNFGQVASFSQVTSSEAAYIVERSRRVKNFFFFLSTILRSLREIRVYRFREARTSLVRGSTWGKSPSLPSTYTGALNQSDAVSCHFGFLFSGQVNFRLRAIFLILTLIIGKEDIAVLGLNGKEDWLRDPTDEMNFQWKLEIEDRVKERGRSDDAREKQTKI